MTFVHAIIIVKTIIIACTKVFKRGNSDGKITNLMKKKRKPTFNVTESIAV